MTADLSALIARLEAAEVGSRELDAAIWCALNGYVFVQWDGAGRVYRERPDWGIGHQKSATISPVTTSLDAALALAERVLGNGPCVLHRNGPNEWGFTYVDDDTAYAATPALSVCAAILRAKQGEGE